MHLKLPDLSTSIQVGSSVEVVVLASLKFHLADYNLTDFGQEKWQSQHLVGLCIQPGKLDKHLGALDGLFGA
jgi:hypothetical protein